MRTQKITTYLVVSLLSISIHITASPTTDLIRIGTDYGGWTIPSSLITKNSICYCAGAGEDISFDIGLIRMFDCHVQTIDPTPRAIKHINYIKDRLTKNQKAYINNTRLLYKLHRSKVSQLHFLPYGLWNENCIKKFYSPKNPAHVSHSILNLQQSSNYFQAQCKTLSTIMKELGHNHIDLLKIDIEGAEYVVLDNILNEKIPVKCICVEFDEFAGPNMPANHDAQACLARANKRINGLLAAGYKIIYQNGMTDMTFLKS